MATSKLCRLCGMLAVNTMRFFVSCMCFQKTWWKKSVTCDTHPKTRIYFSALKWCDFFVFDNDLKLRFWLISILIFVLTCQWRKFIINNYENKFKIKIQLLSKCESHFQNPFLTFRTIHQDSNDYRNKKIDPSLCLCSCVNIIIWFFCHRSHSVLNY